jgi:hypothetical protein
VIQNFSKIEDIKEAIVAIRPEVDFTGVLGLDFPFMNYEDEFTLVHVPSYNGENPHNVVFISKEEIFVYSPARLDALEQKYKTVLKKKHGESTTVLFLVLKSVLKNYSQEFFKIRDAMNHLDLDPVLDSIEETGRALRKLTDRMEGLLQIIIELKENEIDSFNPALIQFDYEILNTEARYWLERCRSHVYRIATLRTKSEMKSNKELNDTMKKLTVIMTFLTIASIVVNVPGTVGAIFGIPAFSDAYFKGHETMLVTVLISTTLLSMLLGFVYWKSLKLKSS